MTNVRLLRSGVTLLVHDATYVPVPDTVAGKVVVGPAAPTAKSPVTVAPPPEIVMLWLPTESAAVLNDTERPPLASVARGPRSMGSEWTTTPMVVFLGRPEQLSSPVSPCLIVVGEMEHPPAGTVVADVVVVDELLELLEPLELELLELLELELLELELLELELLEL